MFDPRLIDFSSPKKSSKASQEEKALLKDVIVVPVLKLNETSPLRCRELESSIELDKRDAKNASLAQRADFSLRWRRKILNEERRDTIAL